MASMDVDTTDPGWSLNINYDKKKYPISISQHATLQELREEISKATGVLPEHQTAMAFKGSNQAMMKQKPDASLFEIGIVREGITIKLFGSKQSTREEFKEGEALGLRRAEAQEKAARSLTNHVVDRKIQEYRFMSFRPLQANVLPANSQSPAEALNLLKALASDPGIVGIMEKYRWKVGVLSEFAPSMETGLVGVTKGCLLGFNRNKGQEISLRLRTDDFKGFRHYRIIIQTLLHELAHMVHSDHDAKFHELNRLLNKEYVALDWRKSQGHQLGKRSRRGPEDSFGSVAVETPAEMARAAALQRYQQEQEDNKSLENPIKEDEGVHNEHISDCCSGKPMEKAEEDEENGDLESMLQQISQLEQPNAIVCLDVLQKCIGNILKNPSQQKFRSIKKDSKLLSKARSVYPFIDRIFQIIGFQETVQDSLVRYVYEHEPLLPLQAAMSRIDILHSKISSSGN